MTEEQLKEATKLKSDIDNKMYNLQCINKVNISRNDYGLHGISTYSGGKYSIPESCKEIVLNIIKAHLKSEIIAMEKRLKEL